MTTISKKPPEYLTDALVEILAIMFSEIELRTKVKEVSIPIQYKSRIAYKMIDNTLWGANVVFTDGDVLQVSDELTPHIETPSTLT
jgi:hypothetical protein